ncbi:MAG: alpha-amylase family glycosyl hydrolase, partial [Balneolales bacterium]|nr:alpha-amylase family glycosyl hydrolase [Balneolales bacterium]
DQDSIYSIEIDGITVGSTIQYKFRYNGTWDDREEFPGAGNNRSYTVQADSNHILVWYNDAEPPTGDPLAMFSAVTSTTIGKEVTFYNLSEGAFTEIEWHFEGGSPETSFEANPTILYSQLGSFDVQLIVSNGTVSDTMLVENYITVIEPETSESEWWNEVVWYEIFVRSFYDSDGDGIGDFNGLTQKLDYLNDGNPDTDTDLGIGGIWLMPIHPSPSYHGYDVTDYRAINPDYGTMEDFKTFLEEAHSRGIRVIIDYVMNHTSNQHPWFIASADGDEHFRDFYRWEENHPGYNGPWGQSVWHQNNEEYYYGLFWSGMPDLNYDNPAVKDSMFSISDFWINEIGIDGFRQDAVLYIHENGSLLKNTPETLNFWAYFNTNLKTANPEAFAVGEAWEPTDVVLQYITNNRLDYAFEFDLAYSMINAVNSGNSANLSQTIQKVYDEYPFLQFSTFLTNHDMDRVMNVLGSDVNKAKAAASLYLTMPGIPYLYYGEEVGMLGKKPDEDIRLPMQWNTEVNAGFTAGTPWRALNSNYMEFNVATMQQNDSSLFNHYRELIQIRNKYGELRTGEFEIGESDNDEMLIYRRTLAGEVSPIVIATNLTSEKIQDASAVFSNQYSSEFPGFAGYGIEEVLYGEISDDDFNFPYNFDDTEIPVTNITLEPYSTVIVKLGVVLTNTELHSSPSEYILSGNYPNPFNPSTNINFTLPTASHVRLSIFDVTGRLVTELLNEQRTSGEHTIKFDASGLSSGVYFYRLETEGFVSTQKMMLIK